MTSQISGPCCDSDMRNFKIGHYGCLGQLNRCHITQNMRALLLSSSGMLCFHHVSHREENGETDKSSCILIVTFLLKLSSQWVKYALACVCIDLPTGEIKKKAKMSEFIYNLARGHMATACYLPSFICHGRGKFPKRKVL